MYGSQFVIWIWNILAIQLVVSNDIDSCNIPSISTHIHMRRAPSGIRDTDVYAYTHANAALLPIIAYIQ